MSVFGRIVKVNQKSTLLWYNGKYIKLDFVSRHNIGDIIDDKDNLITKCQADYNHKHDKSKFNILKRKFEYIKKIREFFSNKGFIEISTPKLKDSILNEVNISTIKTPYGYLTPSPEVEIKKLISLGFDKVFELCPAYRDDYKDSLHKKEFLILEWYESQKSPADITKEFIELIKFLTDSDPFYYNNSLINLNKINFIEYRKLFLDRVNIDIENFNETTVKNRFNLEGDMNRLEILDAVFAISIEKTLGLKCPEVVYNFPKERAALSKIDNNYAKRYEAYIAGIELSNCYDEENSYDEIKKRFNNSDKDFLEAIKKGIPAMSGIAVGVDRLIMILEDLTNINFLNIN
jgi:lysyl-tRNA synthetase class 2